MPAYWRELLCHLCIKSCLRQGVNTGPLMAEPALWMLWKPTYPAPLLLYQKENWEWWTTAWGGPQLGKASGQELAARLWGDKPLVSPSQHTWTGAGAGEGASEWVNGGSGTRASVSSRLKYGPLGDPYPPLRASITHAPWVKNTLPLLLALSSPVTRALWTS